MKIKRTLFIGHRQYCSMTFFILVNCGRRKESYFTRGKKFRACFFFGGVSLRKFFGVGEKEEKEVDLFSLCSI